MFSVNQAHSLGSNLMNTEEQTSKVLFINRCHWVWNPNDSQQITMMNHRKTGACLKRIPVIKLNEIIKQWWWMTTYQEWCRQMQKEWLWSVPNLLNGFWIIYDCSWVSMWFFILLSRDELVLSKPGCGSHSDFMTSDNLHFVKHSLALWFYI